MRLRRCVESRRILLKVASRRMKQAGGQSRSRLTHNSLCCKVLCSGTRDTRTCQCAHAGLCPPAAGYSKLLGRIRQTNSADQLAQKIPFVHTVLVGPAAVDEDDGDLVVI